MQKMMVIDEKGEEDPGYIFLTFALWSETVDGISEVYTVVICRDEQGYLERFPLHKVRFV